MVQSRRVAVGLNFVGTGVGVGLAMVVGRVVVGAVAVGCWLLVRGGVLLDGVADLLLVVSC